MMLSLFKSLHPRKFRSIAFRMKIIFVHVPNALLLHIRDRFSSGRGSFLALSTAGHAEGPRLHQAQVRPTAGLCGACFERSKSRELASNHGVGFRRARAVEDDGNPTFQSFIFAPLPLLYHACVTPSLMLSSSLLCGSHGQNSSRTSSSSLCDGQRRCVFVCVCLPYFLHLKNEHIISREVPRSHGYNNSSGTTTQQHQHVKLWPLLPPRCFYV